MKGKRNPAEKRARTEDGSSDAKDEATEAILDAAAADKILVNLHKNRIPPIRRGGSNKKSTLSGGGAAAIGKSSVSV